MLTRKHIYHYIVYVVFALIFFCGIGLYSVSLNPVSVNNGALLPLIIRYAIVFVAAGFVILIVKFVIPHLPEKYVPEKLPVFPKSVETVTVILVPVLMVFIRIIVITSKIGEDVNNIYYSYALGTTNLLPDTTFATFLYASICRLLCRINSTVYPLYAFNALLQIGIAEFTYFALKRSLRLRYGLLAFALIAFLPYSINSTMNLSPDVLLAFLFAGYIYYLFRINDLNVRGKIEENYHVLYIVGLGVLSGFIAMCDILGISLLLVTVCSLVMVYNRESFLNFQKRSFQVPVYTGSFFVALLVFLFFIPNNGLKNMTNIFNYIFSFDPKGLSLSYTAPMEGRFEGIALFVFAAIAIFAFIRNEADRGLFAVTILSFAAVFTFVNFNASEYAFLVNVFYIIFASIGFFDSFGFNGEPEQYIVKRSMYARNNRDYDHRSSNSSKISKLETVRTVPVRPSRPAPPTIPGRPVPPPKPVETEVKAEVKEVAAPPKIEEKTVAGNGAPETSESKTSIVSAPQAEEKIIETVTVPEVEEKAVETVAEPAEVEEKAAETVAEPAEVKEESEKVLSNDTEKRDKIIPSRRDYRTAHVYKDKEEEENHKMKVANEGISLVEADPNLKAKAMIKNPLPTPKPHVTRELTYDYDLEDGDDFDIKDLKGKDYYDI